MRHWHIFWQEQQDSGTIFKKKEVNLGAANMFCRKPNMSWEQKKKIQGITKASLFVFFFWHGVSLNDLPLLVL